MPNIVQIEGENGLVLTNLIDGKVIELNETERDALLAVQFGNEKVENSLEIIKKLVDQKWIIESDFYCDREDPHSHNFLFNEVSISQFHLQRAIIEISTTCSLKCKFCDPQSTKVEVSCFCKCWPLEVKEFDYTNLIEQLNLLGIHEIIIFGGDPFNDNETKHRLYKLLDEVMKVNPSIRVGIMTNGCYLTEQEIQKLKTYYNLYIHLQLVGTNKDEYDIITKKGSAFLKLQDNIRILKENGIPVMASVLICNAEMLDHVNENMEELDIKFVTKYLFNKKWMDSAVLRNPSNRKKKIDFLSYQISKKLNTCLYGQIFVSGDQKIYPCPFLRDFEWGNLRENSIQEILHKGEYKKFWYMSKEKIDPCVHCKYRLHCFDCRALEYSVNGKLREEYCNCGSFVNLQINR